MYREAPDNAHDSGWRFFSGAESQEYADNAENFAFYDVNTIANYEPLIVGFLRAQLEARRRLISLRSSSLAIRRSIQLGPRERVHEAAVPAVARDGELERRRAREAREVRVEDHRVVRCDDQRASAPSSDSSSAPVIA